LSIRVVDVALYQKGFCWAQAAREGIAAGICKRSEGTGLLDAQFEAHWAAIKAAGLARGAYHFSRWDLSTDPHAEARYFVSHLPPLDEGDFLALDIEESPQGIQAPADLSSWALEWLACVELLTQRNPLVYSDYSFACAHLHDPALAHYGLWVAAYVDLFDPAVSRPPCPVGPWRTVAMWQHTSASSVAGQKVDESVFYGSAEQLRAYGSPGGRGLLSGAGGSKPEATPHPDGPRFLITKAMMARTQPDLGAVKWPTQAINKGAVLNGTGKQTAHWVQVIAGGHPVWIFLPNTRPV
jgi:lysozyme